MKGKPHTPKYIQMAFLGQLSAEKFKYFIIIKTRLMPSLVIAARLGATIWRPWIEMPTTYIYFLSVKANQ